MIVVVLLLKEQNKAMGIFSNICMVNCGISIVNSLRAEFKMSISRICLIDHEQQSIII